MLSSLRSVPPTPRGLSINTSLFQCGIREMHQAFSPNHLFLRCQRPAATFQSSDLLSIILNKDANGSPSWWRTSLPPDLLNTPTLVCLPHHNIPLLLSNSPDSRKQRLEGFCATSGTSSLLLKGAIEEVPQSDLKQGFFIRYFLVPKKGGGLQPRMGPVSSEPLPLQREVQDVDVEDLCPRFKWETGLSLST